MKIPFQDAKIKDFGGFNNIHTSTKGIHGKECINTCDICNIIQCECIVEECQFISLINTWTSIICHVNDFMWHYLNCLKGKCD